jgi:hypothetical protein
MWRPTTFSSGASSLGLLVRCGVSQYYSVPNLPRFIFHPPSFFPPLPCPSSLPFSLPLPSLLSSSTQLLSPNLTQSSPHLPYLPVEKHTVAVTWNSFSLGEGILVTAWALAIKSRGQGGHPETHVTHGGGHPRGCRLIVQPAWELSWWLFLRREDKSSFYKLPKSNTIFK